MPRRTVDTDEGKIVDSDKIVWVVNAPDSYGIVVQTVDGGTHKLSFKTEKERQRFLNEWEE